MTTEEILAGIDREYERCRTDPKQKFLDDVSNNALYWAKAGRDREDVASGVTFSLLAMMDGANLATPPIDLAYSFDPDSVKPGHVVSEYEEIFNADAQLHEEFYPTYREKAEELGYKVVDNRVVIPYEPNVNHRLDGTVATLEDKHSRLVDGSFDETLLPPADTADKMGWLFDNLPAMAGLSDKQKTKIRKDFDASSKRLNKAVQSLANDIRTQMDLVAYTVERGSQELMPTFDRVVPKKTRVKEFIENCANIAEYWGENADTPAEAAEGAIGSILNMLDGGGDIPAIDLIPAVLPELVSDYNIGGMAGWPAEPINDDTELQTTFSRVMRNRRKASAASLA